MTDSPNFYGLFIGVDNYRDPDIADLRFAKRDAEVLHALFVDTFGDDRTALIRDAEVTRERIMAEMCHLVSAATESDVVVLTFSGHGTPSGELAISDTSLDRPAETALPLAELAAKIEAIKAKVLVVVLDCCFAGGAMSRASRPTEVVHQPKVLRPPDDGYASRATGLDVDKLLSRVRGSGRIVLAASASDEKAYEKAEFGHGVLTHYVIKALLGWSGVLDGDEISMLKLAAYVMTQVGWHASGFPAKIQNPVLESTGSNIRFPVLRPGARYAKVGGTFPSPATPALSSLRRHGIPEAFTENWATSFRQMNDIQVDAVNGAGVLRGESVLVSAPTASGKTLIGEFAAVKAKQKGQRTVFLLPSRALVSEQYERFRTVYGPLGVKAIRATGELRDHLPDLFRSDYDFAVLTYEKFTGLLGSKPDLLHTIGVLVVDEIQSLFDPNRGPGLEALFTRIRLGRESGRMPQLVGLSAVLGDPEDLAGWLGTGLVRSRRRSVPLVEGVIGTDGRYRSRRSDGVEPGEPNPAGRRFVNPVHSGSKEDVLIDLVTELVSQGRQVIVFHGTRKDAKSTAELLAGRLRLMPARNAINILRRGDVGVTNDQLRKCLEGGVAFHIADLSDWERQAVEWSFRQEKSEIRVIVATTTLAEGVNLPADAVVIASLKHPGDIDYSVSEYKNMAGRAGRPGQRTDEGQAFIVSTGGVDPADLWNRYVVADPDAKQSALLAAELDLPTLVLEVLSAVAAERGHCHDDDIRDFFAHTLAAHQARFARSPQPFSEYRLQAAVKDLLRHGFIRRTRTGLILTSLGEVVVHRGLGVRSVKTVVEVLENVDPTDLTDRTLLCAAQLTEELHDVRFVRHSNNPRRDLDLVVAWLLRNDVPREVTSRFSDGADRDGRGSAAARRAIASLTWVRARPLTQIEQAMLTTFEVRRPAGDPGPILQAMRRAAEVIGAVIDIARHLYPAVDMGDLPEILPARQELGIVAGHVPIARHLDVMLDRNVFLELTTAGLLDAGMVLDADESTLLDCVGGDHDLLAKVLCAAKAAEDAAAAPTLEDILPLLTD
ncbi:DEAD/DEAH box helicase [Actinosynnema sp. NPDC050436]|uniref:DEAD/DEAH box helicase n=1 Tax=Actinosynnema sp. NPDC050436 TaxID=3155659 RepID=UPI0033D1032D